MLKKLSSLLQLKNKLETVEEKSFWIIALLAAAVGIASLGTSSLYHSSFPTLTASFLFIIVPATAMVIVYVNRNYHMAYPFLCICVGAIAIPFTFIISGGFLSGMPLFCVVGTSISALCYVQKWRIISFLSCLAGNGLAFLYVYIHGSPYPLTDTYAIYNDVIFSYVMSSFALYVSIDFVIVEVRKYRISQDILQQYFDKEKRKEILRKTVPGALPSAGDRKKAVIVFADISRFTTTTERMAPEQTAQFLNEFFTIAEKCIHETGGIIDKFIGDCVMAYWLDTPDENSVYNAVKAVLDIRHKLYLQSETMYEKYGTEINFSAGISYGDVIFGNIGSENMHDYTIIGDAVNTASRIENYACGGELLLSDSAAAQVEDTTLLESVVTDIYFNGKSTPVTLYRVLGLRKGGSGKIAQNRFSGYKLYLCGCRGSFPVSGIRFSEYGGETSCYVLKRNSYAVIIDCGTGLKNAEPLLSDCTKIDILLTHLHYDHILGLLSSKLPADVPVRVFGNFSTWTPDTRSLSDFMEHPYWPVQIKEMDSVDITLGEEIALDEDITATFYRSDHPDDGCVIRLMCGNKKICVLADCEDPNMLDPAIAADSDVLLCDGMYDDSDPVDHTGWGHGTWQRSIEYGNKVKAKRLIITHHNPEFGDHTLLGKENQAKMLLKNVAFAKSGDCIQI